MNDLQRRQQPSRAYARVVFAELRRQGRRDQQPSRARMRVDGSKGRTPGSAVRGPGSFRTQCAARSSRPRSCPPSAGICFHLTIQNRGLLFGYLTVPTRQVTKVRGANSAFPCGVLMHPLSLACACLLSCPHRWCAARPLRLHPPPILLSETRARTAGSTSPLPIFIRSRPGRPALATRGSRRRQKCTKHGPRQRRQRRRTKLPYDYRHRWQVRHH